MYTMRNRISIIAGALLIVASCAEERQENIIPTPGKDVSLSANLNTNQTRTIYGNEESGSVKVNWVDGDLIKVYGTTCAQGRQSAEYKVNNTVTDATGTETKLVQNFANELVKTGEAGVQWGDAETSDFYAVYPSTATISPNGEAGVKVNASIRKNQKNVFKLDGKTWVGTPYDADIHSPSMPDAVMYACTPDVKNGAKVDLRFKPIATVLKFKLLGFDTSTSLTSPTLQVQGITLTAPSNVKIAGGFGLDINRDGTISAQAARDAGNTITIETIQEGGTYVTVEKDMPMEFNVFVIPQTGEEVAVDGDWSITVHTQNENFVVKNYKYSFAKSADKNTTLAAGLIHKLTVPQATVKETADFDPSKWIEQIPRNVYLSELSVPGSWYSLDGNYQATTDLAEQYKKGIRAFHIDCRLTHSRSSSTLHLCFAGTDKFTGFLNLDLDEDSYVINILKNIASLIKPQEYVVVVLTIAEKPKTSSGSTNTFGILTPKDVLSEIASLLSENASDLKLYTKDITSNTTVNDVLGKMIVKVNVNTSDSKFLSYATIPNTLMSEASLASEDKYITGDIVRGVFNQMQTAKMYWNKSESDLTYYYHQAQRTTNSGTVTGVPTIDERKAAITSIISQSSKIYTNGNHNGWFQLGIGGYVKNSSGSENHAAVATSLNTYLLDAINAKMDTDPSPVGIVLMNYCTDDATNGKNGKGQALVNAIIKMNGKFRLNRNPENPEWPDNTSGDTPTPVQSAKAGYSSGFNVDTENWNAF